MRLALVHLVSAKREPDHASYLLLDVPFIPQLSYGHTRGGRIDGLLRQPYELAGIELIMLGKGEEKLALNQLWLHGLISGPSVLPGDISRYGPSVPVSVTLVECTNAAAPRRDSIPLVLLDRIGPCAQADTRHNECGQVPRGTLQSGSLIRAGLYCKADWVSLTAQ